MRIGTMAILAVLIYLPLSGTCPLTTQFQCFKVKADVVCICAPIDDEFGAMQR